uniref:Uncharacterized protein n=1 Tax=Tanacetum cinerariifolium TaxID=118510 RepID=A0A6L2P7U7_TANCI|nr:hypothetical protein [Tanacetum cinerariifolium]
MSNTNNNLQTQTSNALHNAIMEASGKDRLPMLAPEHNKLQSRTKNRGKAIINSSQPTYNQEPTMVAEDDEMSKEKEIDKLMALISLSFKKIYKPTNNNLKTSSNTSRANQDNTLRINEGTRYNNQRSVNVARARENVGTQPLQKVQNNDDDHNVFANDREHPKQPEYVNDTYLNEQDDTNITKDSSDMSNNGGEADQDEDNELAREHDLLASLIKKLKVKLIKAKIIIKY